MPGITEFWSSVVRVFIHTSAFLFFSALIISQIRIPANSNDSVQKVKEELYDLMKSICDVLDTCCLDQLPSLQRKDIKECLIKR